MKKLIFLIWFITNTLFVFSQQNNLCNTADPFCTGTTYNFPAGVGAGSGQTGPNYGCLYSQPNPAWYYMQVGQSGNITIYMHSVPNNDIDFACWGPFTSPTAPCVAQLTATCTGCTNNTSAPAGYYPQGNLADCSYSTLWNETCHLPNAIAGQWYILLITNFSNQPCNIIFSQTGGPGTTNCGILAPPITDNGPLCVGDTLVFNVTTPYPGATYAWTGPNGFTSTQMNPVIPNVTTGVAGVYSMTVTVGSQTSPAVTDTVVINPPPSVTASNNSPQCISGTVNLSGSGGTSYQWSGPLGFTSTLQNPSITGITFNNTGTYNVTVTDANTCTAITSTTVSIYPHPVISASNNGPKCYGDSLHIFSSGGVQYSWSGPGGFASTLQNPTLYSIVTGSSGVYTVTVTDASGCTGITTTTVVVNPLPVPTAISNSPICSGTLLILTGGGGAHYLWSGPNGFTSSLQVPSISNATVLSGGTYNVTVTSSNSCVSTTSTLVTINALPMPVAGSNSPICSGDTLELTVTGAVGTYSWTGPGGFSSTDQNPNFPQSSNILSGLYTVTITDANSCTMVSSVNATVNTIYPNIGNNSPICSGTSLNMTASGGVLYSWSGPNSFTSTQSNIVLPQSTTSNNGIYTVTITDANGCVAELTTNVVINPPPFPVATNNTPICAGSDLQLSGGGGSTFYWSGPAGFVSTSQNPIIPSATVYRGGIYTIVVTDLNGCVSTTSTNVTINPLPVVIVSNNSPICSGSNLNITATGGTTYSWSCAENGFTSFSQNPAITGATVQNSGHYNVTVTLNGCTSTATTNVIVNAPPEPTATSNSPVCYGNPLKLIATGGITYSWSSSNGYTSFYPQPIINNSTDAASGTYTVTVTDINGCVSTTSTLVTVSTKIIASTMDLTICSGTTVNILAYAIGGTPPYRYFWDGVLSPNQIPVTPLTDVSYAVQIEDTNGCKSNISTLHIAVLQPMKIQSYSNKDTVCPGESVIINVIPIQGDGGTYIYYLKDGTIITPPYTAYPDGLHDYIIFAKDGCGSIDSDTIRVRLYNIPPISFSPDKTFGCVPLTVYFNETSSDEGQSYHWDFGDAGNNNTSYIQTPSHTYINSGKYDIRLTITSKDGCKTDYTYPQLITSYPLPGSSFISDKVGANIISGEVHFTNMTKEYNKSYWTFGDGDSTDVPNPVHRYDSVGMFRVMLVSETLEGCRDTAIEEMPVVDQYTFYAPTAFTPGNDETNDYFFILGNGIDSKSFKMIIYDRWGEKVFETDKYDSTNPKMYGWDGKVKGKVYGEPGIYTWLVIYKDKLQVEHQKTGVVTVIK